MAIQPVEQGSAFAFRNVINNNFYELKVLSGASKPTQSTAAVVGQMYLDTSEGKMYFCSNVSGSVYTWKPFSEFSGSYNDLKDKPSLFSGNYNDLTNKPDSSKISYNNDLSSLEADNVQNAIDEIISLKAAKNGFATLDSSGKVPSTQLPSMNYIPVSQKGAKNGVATLDNNGHIPSSQFYTEGYNGVPLLANGAIIQDQFFVRNVTSETVVLYRDSIHTDASANSISFKASQVGHTVMLELDSYTFSETGYFYFKSSSLPAYSKPGHAGYTTVAFPIIVYNREENTLSTRGLIQFASSFSHLEGYVFILPYSEQTYDTTVFGACYTADMN